MAIDVPVVSTLLRVNGVTAETAPSKIREILRGASYSETDIDEAILMVSRWGSTPPLPKSASQPLPGNPLPSVPYPSPLPLPPLESLTNTSASNDDVFAVPDWYPRIEGFLMVFMGTAQLLGIASTVLQFVGTRQVSNALSQEVLIYGLGLGFVLALITLLISWWISHLDTRTPIASVRAFSWLTHNSLVAGLLYFSVMTFLSLMSFSDGGPADLHEVLIGVMFWHLLSAIFGFVAFIVVLARKRTPVSFSTWSSTQQVAYLIVGTLGIMGAISTVFTGVTAIALYVLM